VKIYDLDTAKSIRKIEHGDSKIYSLLVLDNFLLCTGDDEGCFRLWDYRVNRGGAAMEMKQCEDFISDFDVDRDKRLVLASSGEGTLTAFNIRAKRMVEPQSELFDAGFQAVRFAEDVDRAVVGAEDGSINLFKLNEWGNIIERFPLVKGRRQTSFSIECIERISAKVFVAGCSDGIVRSFSINPNRALKIVETHETPVECIAIQDFSNSYASVDANTIRLGQFENVNEGGDDKSSDEDEGEAKTQKKEKPTNDFFSGLA